MPIHFEPDVPDTRIPDSAHIPHVADISSATNVSNDSKPLPDEFARAVDGVTAMMQQAESAEDNFASGLGSLEKAVYERARADIALSVATATTGRILQSVQSLLSMQV
jgi:flagellar hook-basal body complex protein FliE